MRLKSYNQFTKNSEGLAWSRMTLSLEMKLKSNLAPLCRPSAKFMPSKLYFVLTLDRSSVCFVVFFFLKAQISVMYKKSCKTGGSPRFDAFVDSEDPIALLIHLLHDLCRLSSFVSSTSLSRVLILVGRRSELALSPRLSSSMAFRLKPSS